jgi:hypothetical protein
MDEIIKKIVSVSDNGKLFNVEIEIEKKHSNEKIYTIHNAIESLAESNTKKFIEAFELPYKVNFTKPFRRLKNSLKYEAEHSIKQAEECLNKDEISQLIDIVMTQYHAAIFRNNEWYRLAKENSILRTDFSDNYCDETTFFQDGILESFIGVTKQTNTLKLKVESLIGEDRASEIEYGLGFDYVIGLIMSIYGYCVADMELSTNLHLALDYINFAKESKHCGHVKSFYNDMERDRKNEVSLEARKRALKRHQDSPKQKLKALVKKHWLDERENPKYPSKAKFVSAMLELTKDSKGKETLSYKTIYDDWYREWKNELLKK